VHKSTPRYNGQPIWKGMRQDKVAYACGGNWDGEWMFMSSELYYGVDGEAARRDCAGVLGWRPMSGSWMAFKGTDTWAEDHTIEMTCDLQLAWTPCQGSSTLAFDGKAQRFSDTYVVTSEIFNGQPVWEGLQTGIKVYACMGRFTGEWRFAEANMYLATRTACQGQLSHTRGAQFSVADSSGHWWVVTPRKSQCAAFSYKIGEWSDCSLSCGVLENDGSVQRGMMSRNVHCIGSPGNVTLSCEYCGCVAKPVAVRSCIVPKCIIYRWTHGEWGSCSQTCVPQAGGEGVRSRALTCKHEDKTVPDVMCQNVPVPAAHQMCISARRCPVYRWGTSEWASCSASCGPTAVRTRERQCHNALGQSVILSLCENKTTSAPLLEACPNVPSICPTEAPATCAQGSERPCACPELALAGQLSGSQLCLDGKRFGDCRCSPPTLAPLAPLASPQTQAPLGTPAPTFVRKQVSVFIAMEGQYTPADAAQLRSELADLMAIPQTAFVIEVQMDGDGTRLKVVIVGDGSFDVDTRAQIIHVELKKPGATLGLQSVLGVSSSLINLLQLEPSVKLEDRGRELSMQIIIGVSVGTTAVLLALFVFIFLWCRSRSRARKSKLKAWGPPSTSNSSSFGSSASSTTSSLCNPAKPAIAMAASPNGSPQPQSLGSSLELRDIALRTNEGLGTPPAAAPPPPPQCDCGAELDRTSQFCLACGRPTRRYRHKMHVTLMGIESEMPSKSGPSGLMSTL
jgi:hypothetical protein